LRQVFVSRTQEQRVRLWVAQYREIRELEETLARLHLKRLPREPSEYRVEPGSNATRSRSQ
jgi:hypothetical protein